MARNDDESIFSKCRPNARWFPLAGIDNDDKEEKKRLVQRLVATTDLFDVVKLYIEEKRNEITNHEQSEDDFADAAWSHKQAWRNGYKAAMRDVTNFLPTPKKED